MFQTIENNGVLKIYDYANGIAEIDEKNEVKVIDPLTCELPEAKAYILGQQQLRRNLQTNPAIIEQMNKLSYRKVADFLPLAAGKIEMSRYHVYHDYRLVVDSVTVYRTPVFYEDAEVMNYEDFTKKLDDPESEFYKDSVKVFSVQAVLINDYEVDIKKDDAWTAELSDIEKLHNEYGDRLSILVKTRQKNSAMH